MGSGVILEAVDLDDTDDLISAVGAAGAETILDPLSVELSTPGGSQRRGVRDLTWAGPNVHEPGSFTDRFSRHICDEIAQTAVAAKVTAVLAPSHYLVTLPSPWLGVDARLAMELRHALNDHGGSRIGIYYPLVLSLKTTGRGAAMMYLVDFLRRIRDADAIDALTLRVHGFGVGDSSPNKIQRFIDLARSLHDLQLPIIGEKTGTLGLALMAFGSVGAIESGLTLSDTCDLGDYATAGTAGGGFMPAPRVYLPALGGFLKKAQARKFLTKGPLRHYYTCQEPCCRGVDGMLEDPRRHFVARRTAEVAELAEAPPDLRADLILKKLASANDLIRKAMEVEPGFKTHAKRLVQWERALAEQRASDRYNRALTRAAKPHGRTTAWSSTQGSRTPDLKSADVIDINRYRQ